MLITKGDLFDQESKLARSGLGDRFERVEIVAKKDEKTYERVLRRHALDPSRFLMVGNSPRRTSLPVLALGGWAVHVPYPLTWAHEEDVDEAWLVVHRATERSRRSTSSRAARRARARMRALDVALGDVRTVP